MIPTSLTADIARLAPLLVLCVLLGICPWLLLDWMDTSVIELMRMLGKST